MITKTPVPNSSAVKISTATATRAAMIYTFDAGTVYVSIDGTTAVTGPSGASPGLPLTSTAPILIHNDMGGHEFSADFYARNDSGAEVNVIVQRI